MGTTTMNEVEHGIYGVGRSIQEVKDAGNATSLSKVCDICGDSGYMELILTCNCCKRASRHTYCMQGDPLVVPDVWYCEKCLPEDHLVQGKMPDTCTDNNSQIYNYDLKENLSQTKGSPYLNNGTASEETNDGRKRQKLKHTVHLSSSNAFHKAIANAKVKFIPPEEVALTIQTKICCVSANSGASRHQSDHANVIYPVNSRKALTYKRRYRSLSTIGVLNKQTKSIVRADAALSTRKFIMTMEDSTDVKERRMQKNKVSASDACLDASSLRNDGEKRDMSKFKAFGEASNTRSEDKHKAISIVADESYPQQEHNQRKATKFVGVGVEHTRDEKVRIGETLGSSYLNSLSALAGVRLAFPAIKLLFILSISFLAKADKKEVPALIGKVPGGVEYCAALRNIPASKENVPSLTLLISPSESSLNFTAQEPCWRGNFEVFDMVNHVYDDIQAQFPLQVSHKAYEISKKLPESLKLDMVPRKVSWSKKFQSDPPTYKDIGLYFFPSQFERQREKYFRLLKRIDSRDFTLKAWIGDVALLMYSSKQLRVDCQRIDGQSFLWGIFWHLKHRKEHQRRQDIIHSTATIELKSNACDQSIVDFEGCEQEVDMEIDMIGGKEIGQPDQPIRKSNALTLCRPVVKFSLKKTRSTLSNVPLAFSTPSNTKVASVSPTANMVRVAPAVHDNPLSSKTSSTNSYVPPGIYSTSNTKLTSVSPVVDKIQSVPEIHDSPLDGKSNSSFFDVPPGLSRTSNKKLTSVSTIVDKIPERSQVHDSLLNSKTSSSHSVFLHGFYRASDTELASVPPIVDKIQSAPETHDSQPLNSKTSSTHSDVALGFSRTSNTKLASASPTVDKIQSAPEVYDSPRKNKSSSSSSNVPPGFSRTSNTKLAGVTPIDDKMQLDPKICDSLLCRKISSSHSDVPPGFSTTPNTKQVSISPNAGKIQSVPEIHDSPLRSISTSQKLAAILPLFPQEAESMKFKENSNKNIRQMISVDLSLSRPDSLMDGNVCISPTPRVSFDQDGCEVDLQLKL